MLFISMLAAAALTLAADPAPRHVHHTAQEPARPAPERQDHAGHAHGKAAEAGAMPLLAGLGDWHRRVTSSSPEAQRYFDQGLRLTYGFNHEEAARSFERAVALDPDCAMCHWGIAYAVGPNINLPMDA
jgi:hypothetical protein